MPERTIDLAGALDWLYAHEQVALSCSFGVEGAMWGEVEGPLRAGPDFNEWQREHGFQPPPTTGVTVFAIGGGFLWLQPDTFESATLDDDDRTLRIYVRSGMRVMLEVMPPPNGG